MVLVGLLFWGTLFPFFVLFRSCVFGSVFLGLASATACSGCPCFGWPFASVLPLWFSFLWCCGASFFLLLLFGVSGVVACSFLLWCLPWLRFWPALSWLCPLPPPPPLVCPLGLPGPVSALLVPPSGYLVVSATVRLSYLWYGVLWLIGSCLHSSSWQQRLRPCVGLCPLHHVVGVVHVPLAPALRYSPLGDPEPP